MQQMMHPVRDALKANSIMSLLGNGEKGLSMPSRDVPILLEGLGRQIH